MSARRSPPCCSVVELRQYTMQPGQRDALIELFEREFIESQEAVGMHVIGHFRDLDRPDMYVWLRGFDDMNSRRGALAAFYDGPTWLSHRNEANATLVDSDDVLLLRPTGSRSRLDHSGSVRPTVAAACSGPASDAVFELTVYSLAGAGDTDTADLNDSEVDASEVDTAEADAAGGLSFATIFERQAVPVLDRLGMRPCGWFVTETADNSYPRLPVRTGEHVLVSITRFDDEDALSEAGLRRAAEPRWIEVEARLDGRSTARQVMRLSPASRSALR